VLETIGGVELPAPHVSFGQLGARPLFSIGRVLEVRSVGGVLFALAALSFGRLLLALGLLLPIILPVILLVVRHGGRDGEKHDQENREWQQVSKERA